MASIPDAPQLDFDSQTQSDNSADAQEHATPGGPMATPATPSGRIAAEEEGEEA